MYIYLYIYIYGRDIIFHPKNSMAIYTMRNHDKTWVIRPWGCPVFSRCAKIYHENPNMWMLNHMKKNIWGWFITPIRPVILVVLEIGTTLTLFFHWLSHVVFFKSPWTGPTPSPYQDLLASSQASLRIGCCGFEARAERTDGALLHRHSLGFAGFADAWAWIRGSMQYRSLGKKSI